MVIAIISDAMGKCTRYSCISSIGFRSAIKRPAGSEDMFFQNTELR